MISNDIFIHIYKNIYIYRLRLCRPIATNRCTRARRGYPNRTPADLAIQVFSLSPFTLSFPADLAIKLFRGMPPGSRFCFPYFDFA